MIEVVSPGLYSSIQDLGRKGYRKYGVPVSGAMDLYSAKLANQLAGNSDNEAVLEMTLLGPTLKFMTPCTIVITGADFHPQINGRVIEINKVMQIEVGQTLKLGSANSGMRAYLAVEGGFDAPIVLNSCSQYKGLTQKAIIVKGDSISVKNNSSDVSSKKTILKKPVSFLNDTVIEVFKGPEFGSLSEPDKQKLVNAEFKISSQSNRMGYRLISDIKVSAQEIITSPVQPGTVQLTPSGQLIILGRDAQTTGGYARILQLTEKAQNILAQKQFESSFSFRLKK